MNKIINVDELRNTILTEEKLYPGDKISYVRLVEISKKYNLTPYTLSIGIFKVSNNSYRGMKNKSSNANNIVILKDLVPEMIKNAVNMREEIMKKENLKEGDKIYYSQLKEISEKYNIPEKVLALDVFDIVQYSYTKIKNRTSERAVILYKKFNEKKYNIKEDKQLDDIRTKILSKESLKIGGKINYNELVRISKKYGMSESYLAFDIFNISKISYAHMKSDEKRNSTILKYYLLDEKLEELREKIILEENLKSYDNINYDDLQKISNKYFIDEKILAVQILMITPNQYYNMKHMRAATYILKNNNKDSDEVENLKHIVFNKEQLKIGDSISYDKIIEIQNKYNLMLQDTLYILGISEGIFYSLKHNNQSTTVIKDSNIFLITLVLSEILEKERYYTKQELERICNVNNISLEDFFMYNLGSKFDYDSSKYLNVLERYNKIWIQDFKQPFSEFVNSNSNILVEVNNKSESISDYWTIEDIEKLIILSENFTLNELSEILKKDALSIKYQLEKNKLNCMQDNISRIGRGAYKLSNN